MTLEEVAALEVDPATARVYEHGWQSWSPSTTYRLGDRRIRPRDAGVHLMNARPGTSLPADAFAGEGLLAVLPAEGDPVRVFAATDPALAPASIRATVEGGRLVVWADGPIETVADAGAGGIDAALARWADGVAARAAVRGLRPPPTGWCTWYHYFTDVTVAEVLENLDAIGRLDLPVGVVQVDDGWQAGIGDWLAWSPGFARFDELVAAIVGTGRTAGAWVAPFLAGSGSRLAAEHPEWLVRAADGDGPAWAGRNWEQDLYALDWTHPGARGYLAEVFGTLRALGVRYLKLDFLYAGAIPGRRHADAPPLAAYRDAIAAIRGWAGEETYLVGCGAPVLPSVGLFDAMRVSPDTAPYWEPESGDLCDPGARSAVITGAGRAWQHGRFWVNDPDCLIVRPAVERREAWAAHVERFGGLRVSSDRLADLDGWGLDVTRRLLGTPAPPRFVAS